MFPFRGRSPVNTTLPIPFRPPSMDATLPTPADNTMDFFQRPQIQPRPSMGNPLFDSFINKILPMLQQRERMKTIIEDRRIRGQRRYESEEAQKNRDFQGTLATSRLQQVATPRLEEPEPMDTYFRPYSDFATRADLQSERLQSAEKIAGDKLMLALQQAEETERKNKAGEEIGRRKVEETERSSKQKAELANKRIAISQIKVDKEMPEKDKLELKARLDRELQELKGDQSMEAVVARGEIQQKIAELQIVSREKIETDKRESAHRIAVMRGNLPTQQRAEFQNKINMLRITRPDLAQFLETDPNTKDITVNKDDMTEEQFKELTKLLGESRGSDTGPIDTSIPDKAPDKPPAGAKPGGTWTKTSRGWIYRQP